MTVLEITWQLEISESITIASEKNVRDWVPQMQGKRDCFGLFFVKRHDNEVNLCQIDTKRYGLLGRVW